MSRRGKAFAVVLAALVAMVLVVANASAALVVNGAPLTVTGTAGTTRWISAGSGVTATCTRSVINDTVNADGTSTIALGSATFGPTCRESLLGASWVITQMAALRNLITALLNGSGQIVGLRFDFIVPTRGIRVDAFGCSFYLSGTQSVLIPTAATTPPALVSVSSLPFGDAALNLVIGSSSGILCGAIGISDGAAARFEGTYSLSLAVSGTLVP